MIDDSSIRLTAYLGNDTNVVIPSTIDGYTVVSFGYSFAYDENLVSITIPASVIYIYIYIYEDCFDGCSSLTAINVDANNSYYSSIDGVLFNKNQSKLICYPAGKTASSYTIPEGVVIIGSYAFEDCTSLKSLTFPSTLTYIEEYAFFNSGLINVTIPDGVIYYSNNDYETNISADGNYVYYTCSDGKYIIISSYLGDDKDVIIPSTIDGYTVLGVGNYAFSESDITSVVIPDTVTYIGEGAFCDCANLESVTIPDSVTYIGDEAFAYCPKLLRLDISTSVLYIGEYAFASDIDWDKDTATYKITLYGYAGSYAEKYANENGIKGAWEENSSANSGDSSGSGSVSGTSSDGATSSNPQTGDQSLVSVYGALMTISVLGACVLYSRKKRYN
ncbi:MAG: leucine-rich repeat domain-containing protein [Erysipelotrichaceae bacterium]|nr:leucine-rich repeat domain-containing protein [Erysipelotrichaceae bacterium]